MSDARAASATAERPLSGFAPIVSPLPGIDGTAKLVLGGTGGKVIRQLKKKLQIDGIKRELKRREYYEKPSVKRKKKALAAKKRAVKR